MWNLSFKFYRFARFSGDGRQTLIFGHLKAIGASKEAQPLLDKAGWNKEAIDLSAAFVNAAAKRF
jgi:hypothetical protein